MAAQKRKNSIGGRIAWALVWFVIGAAAGLLLSKLGGPPAQKEPLTASRQAGDTVASQTGQSVDSPKTPTTTGDISGETATVAKTGDTAEVKSGDTAQADVDADSGKDTGEQDADTTTPRMTVIQRDQESVKRRIYDYYAALSRDDLQGSLNCWHDPSANTKANIQAAMRDFAQILVKHDTLKITDLQKTEATVTFTIRAYYKNEAFKIYKKGAKLTKQNNKWKLVDTWNP